MANSKSQPSSPLNIDDLRELAEERLGDAKALYDAGRYKGAFYICGYAIELALKKRICATLGWELYPNKGQDYKTFLTHDLEILLHLSGVEGKIALSAEWSIILDAEWNSEIRYSSEKKTDEDAKLLIEASRGLLKLLWMK